MGKIEVITEIVFNIRRMGHMKESLISVVLPIYNVEKYLNRCINSVINQSYHNLEIILVDDGSLDKCPQICDEWAKKDRRIKVIHKKNAGLGYARNTGIENACGEYICFIDSDDYVALDMIERTYSLAKKTNADIVSYGYCFVDSKGEKGKSFIPRPNKMFFEGEDILSYVLPNMLQNTPKTGCEFWMSMCGGLFSFDLIKRANWYMVSEREVISEDVFSLLRLYKNVKSIAFIAEVFYYYCENTKSLTHTYRIDRYERIKHFYDVSIAECDRLGYSEVVKTRLANPYLANTLATLKMIITSDLDSKEKKKKFRKIVGDEHLQRVLRRQDKKYISIQKKLLWAAMRKRMYLLCYLMIWAKT